MPKASSVSLLLFLAAGPLVGNVHAGTTAATVTAAARILDQASFGPRISDIQHVEQTGVAGYVSEQLNMPITWFRQFSNPLPAPCVSDQGYCLSSNFWSHALTAPDQLRQRVAFALSEIWTVSTNQPPSQTPSENRRSKAHRVKQIEAASQRDSRGSDMQSLGRRAMMLLLANGSHPLVHAAQG